MKLDYRSINTFLCCLFFIALLVTPKSYIWGPIGLVLLSLLSIKTAWRNIKVPEIKIICLSLVPYFILVVISFFLYGGNTSQLDMPSRTLLASLVLLHLYQFPPKKLFVFYSIPIGGIITGMLALFHVLELSPRAFMVNDYMVIQAAGMCATLGVLSLVTYFYAKITNKKVLYVLSIVGATSALLACLLTGARGAWVLTPVVILTLIWNQRFLISKTSGVVSIIVAAICLIFASPQITARLSDVASDAAMYTEGKTVTSTGIRIELWKSSIYSFLDKPLFGQGFDGTMEAKKKQFSEGKVTEAALGSRRAHNQFFEDMQTKGSLGIIVLISMFYFPYRVFKKIYKGSTTSIESRYFALMGICHIALVIGYSMTQHYLNHHSGIILYTMGTVILASLCLPEKKTENDI
ncbi:O-antigen ligase family protein [Vibrio sp. SCSIO 43137]|uniref:O-antigen ligase family protein n=1 Tax=Vibrio sp. SCSIO 43137 TaxID=3021011 RepID=UPI00230784F3|nr:O-antigen ligase family protein [Vibrio sp. SCSIO 43137]WCE29861.1 O-antigen ligase family protein [Vibrio sp. SCSIO 43137]